MQFTYTYLKNAEMNNVTVGRYNGYDVVPTTKERLARNGERDDYIYLLYDDNNLLYRNGKVFANVDKNGNVTEFMSRRYLLHERRKEAEAVKVVPRAESSEERTAAETTPMASHSEDIIADVALGILVEDTLKGARDMSIDSLLEGFDYGL